MNHFKNKSDHKNKLLQRFNVTCSSRAETSAINRGLASSIERDDTLGKYRNHINFLENRLDEN